MLSMRYIQSVHRNQLISSVAVLAPFEGMASSTRKRPASHTTDAEALVEIHRGPYISERGLAHVFKYIRDNGMPDTISRTAQYRAKEEVVAKETTPYGHVLRCIDMQLENGKPFQNWACAPGPMLYATCKSSGGFRSLMRQQLCRHPCTPTRPWRICLYFDGISPRDPLAKGRDYRGVDAIYWSFLEFDEHLSNEDAWFVLSAARVAMVRKLPGGIGQSLRILLKMLFFNADAGEVNLKTTGITLDISENGDSATLATLVAKLECTIGDEEALRELHMNKGHAGTKPCAICRNMVNHKFDYSQYDVTDWYVSDASLDKSKWVANTDESVVAILRRNRPHWERMDNGEITDERFRTLTQLSGWNYHPNHIALDPHLGYGVMSLLCFDWMHVYVVGGIVDRETNAFLSDHSVAYIVNGNDLDAYFQTWTWPKSIKHARRVFDTGELAAGASETLSAMPVLARYVREIVAKVAGATACANNISSFLALCDTLDLFVALSRGARVSHAELSAAIMHHLRLHKACYGTKVWTYKFHMATHLPDMYQKFGLLSCFVHERKHKVVKRFTHDHICLRRPEKALMLQLIAQHRHDLNLFSVATVLQDPISASKKLLECLTHLRPQTQSAVSSTTAFNNMNSFSRGDIVLMGCDTGHSAVQIWFHVQCDVGTASQSEPLSLILRLTTRQVHAGWSKYTIDEDQQPCLVPVSTLKHATAFRRTDSVITCIWPAEYRRNWT